ncbi:Aldehyde/histidinol dehydrogenase [Aspergillus pseudoustus]|uniref:Aldehyde/histidinol dehydrogenase n=1 Tax=Aspergillus pseudoustus TaxID=1810923 RepID=A0ABR4K805_9EURO
MTSRAKFMYRVREPLGVCMASWKLGPANAYGNGIVLKAAELSILYFANLIVEAGSLPGVINIIKGHGSEAGSALVRHLQVDKIAFTGSTATGKQIMKLASNTLKNITLETGGKSPFIIFSDALLENACHWSAAETYHGPQVSKQQFDKILAYAKTAREQGASILAGGTTVASRPNNKGYFVALTILRNVTPEMTVYKEEIFGPFAVFVKFNSEQDVIRMANETDYGLAAALCTSNIVLTHSVAGKLKAGMIWINSNNSSDFRVPFGGVKQSGIGRELGQAGLDAYSNVKAVHLNLNLDTEL